MNLHSIHHVSFEGLGRIADWAEARGWSRSATWQHRGDALPDLEMVDLLVVTGGPMSVGDEAEFPWLRAEKDLIRDSLRRGIPTLGICLGAQLIAEVCGAAVAPMGRKEIGWFPVRKHADALSLAWMDDFPETQTVLHWHGDQFQIPAGARRLWSSELCPNQGFCIGSALGLQFHLELGREDLSALLENARNELWPPAPGIQGEVALLSVKAPFEETFRVMEGLLDAWLEGCHRARPGRNHDVVPVRSHAGERPPLCMSEGHP